MTRAPLASTLLTIALAWNFGGVALASETYSVSGRDTFVIGSNEIRSEVSYAGTQTLYVTRRGHVTRYRAHVTYQRSDGAASTPATGEYIIDVSPSGETLDGADRDPDYLTVLNQPFAAQLDAATLADLRQLHGAVPFDFPSPITGASLHGYLQHVPGGRVGAQQALGVRFEAAGPMRGALPDRPELTLNGSIAMRGTAYYDLGTALLLALETIVTINGNVSNRAGGDSVTIVYSRTIRVPARGLTAPWPSPSAGTPAAHGPG